MGRAWSASVPRALAAATVALALLLALIAGPPPRPDVVLISLDTVRADRVSALFPIGRHTTPNLERLPGARFRNCWATAPYTAGSHAAILSGQYRSSVHYGVSRRYFAAADRVLPEMLHDAGYYTAAITAGGFMGKRWGVGRGFSHFEEAKDWDHGDEVGLTRRWLARWRHKRFAKRGAPPLFLFVHTYLAHQPYLSDRWGNALPDRYDADVREADGIVGVVWHGLEELRGARDRGLVVIVVADHGEEMGEHGRWGMHAKTLYSEVLHVPCVWAEPGLPRRMIDERAALIDVVPTVLARVGLPVPAAVDGVSLLPLIDGGHWERRNRLLFSVRHTPPKYMSWRVMADEGVYIEDFGSPIAYYPLDDPAQKRNAWDPTDPIQQWLALATEEFRGRWKESSEQEPAFDPLTRAKLEALGYVLGPDPAKHGGPLKD